MNNNNSNNTDHGNDHDHETNNYYFYGPGYEPGNFCESDGTALGVLFTIFGLIIILLMLL